jgi:hypothetical protein
VGKSSDHSCTMAADAEPWVLLSIGAAFVVLRLCARWSKVGLRQFELDDYLMVVFLVSDSKLELFLPLCNSPNTCSGL